MNFRFLSKTEYGDSMLDKITSSYIHSLQAIYHEIDNRGLCIDKESIDHAKQFVRMDITRNCAIASSQWACHVYIGGDNGYSKGHPEYLNQVNINSSSGEKTLLKKLKDLGYKVPPITKRNEDGEYETAYSSGELTLQKMLVTNQFNYAGGDPAIRAVLAIRELGKLQSSYLNCRFYKSRNGNLLYLSHYNCAGTLTGRRSSKKHTFGYGNNAQNFPKHGKLSKIFRRCIVARPGNIFLMVDQKGAEEWPVNALAENHTALDEMRAGVNRHIRRAAGIFNIAELSRTEEQWKESIEYYLGKKTGHARNYGMKAQRLSDSLATEGHSIPVMACKLMLQALANKEPQTETVFHKYIKDQINITRILKTPFGRERQFLGLRPNDENYKVFNEAFSYIPQSCVGDNTGFAMHYMESESKLPLLHRFVVQESHDSLVVDIPDDKDIILAALLEFEKAFDRDIIFHNGIKIKIPIEAEIGYNWADTVKIKSHDMKGIKDAKDRLEASNTRKNIQPDTVKV